MDKISTYIIEGDISKLRNLLHKGELTSEKIEQALKKNPQINYLEEAINHEKIQVMEWLARQFPEKLIPSLIIKILREGNPEHERNTTNEGKSLYTAVELAVKFDYIDIFEVFIKNGGDPNIKRDLISNKGSLLFLSLAQNNWDIFNELIKSGADINARHTGQSTPLMEAISGQHKAAALKLIEAGADVNLKAAWGNTALTVAAMFEDTSMVRILLNAGASSRDLNFITRVYYSLSIAQASLLQFCRYIGRKLGLLPMPIKDEFLRAISSNNAEKFQSIIGGINLNHFTLEGIGALEFAIQNKAGEDYIREISRQSAPWVVIKAIKDCVEAPNRHAYLPALLERKDCVKIFVLNNDQKQLVTWANRHKCVAAVNAFNSVDSKPVDETKKNDGSNAAHSDPLIHSQNDQKNSSIETTSRGPNQA